MAYLEGRSGYFNGDDVTFCTSKITKAYNRRICLYHGYEHKRVELCFIRIVWWHFYIEGSKLKECLESNATNISLSLYDLIKLNKFELFQSMHFGAKVAYISLPKIKIFPQGKLSCRLYIDFHVKWIFLKFWLTFKFRVGGHSRGHHPSVHRVSNRQTIIWTRNELLVKI